MQIISDYSRIDDLIRPVYGHFADLVIAVIINNRSGIVDSYESNINAKTMWYHWRNRIYIEVGDVKASDNICISLNTQSAYEQLFPDRSALCRHYKVLHKIHPVVQPPEDVQCIKILNGYGGIYTILCYDSMHVKYSTFYVYTPIAWIHSDYCRSYDPWLILKHTCNIVIPSTINKRVWSTKIAAQIAQNVIKTW